MPTSDEHSRPPGGTVYGAPARPRAWLPRDRMMLAALAIGAVGLLAGVLLAAGVFSGGDGDSRVVPAAAGSGTPASATPGGSAAGATSATPTPTPTPTPAVTTPPPVGPKVFHSALSSLCLDVPADEDPEGARVEQAACSGAPSQQWVPIPAGGDAVTVVSAATGKCLDVNEASRDDGASVQQWSCNGGANQQWRLTATGTGPVLLVSVNSGKCLDVPDASTSPGTELKQNACTGAPSQQRTAQ